MHENVHSLKATRVATFTNQGNGPSNMDVVGDVLYVSFTNDYTVVSYDITNPASPSPLGSVTVGYSTAWIKSKGRYLYVTDQGDLSLRVVNVSDPANMSVEATFVYMAGVAGGGGRFAIEPHGPYMLIGGPESGVNANKAALVNIANPLVPVVSGTIVVGGTHRGVAAVSDGMFALASRDDHKVLIIDHAVPAVPTPIATITTPGEVTAALAVQGSYLFVGDYGDPGHLHGYDISVPATPLLVSTTTIGAGCEKIEIRGGYAYCALRATNQFVVVDVLNPAKPEILAVVASTGTTTPAAFPAKGYVYFCANGDPRNGIIDVIQISDNPLRRIAALEELLDRRVGWLR